MFPKEGRTLFDEDGGEEVFTNGNVGGFVVGSEEGWATPGPFVGWRERGVWLVLGGYLVLGLVGMNDVLEKGVDAEV